MAPFFLVYFSPHDMRIPIQHALTYPERMQSRAGCLDLAGLGSLHFEMPDLVSFPRSGSLIGPVVGRGCPCPRS